MTQTVSGFQRNLLMPTNHPWKIACWKHYDNYLSSLVKDDLKSSRKGAQRAGMISHIVAGQAGTWTMTNFTKKRFVWPKRLDVYFTSLSFIRSEWRRTLSINS